MRAFGVGSQFKSCDELLKINALIRTAPQVLPDLAMPDAAPPPDPMPSRRLCYGRVDDRRVARVACLAACGLIASTSGAYAFDIPNISSDMIAATLVASFLGAMITFVCTRGRNASLLRAALELRDGTELLLRDGRAALLYWNLVKGELCWSESLFTMLGRKLPDGRDALPRHARSAASRTTTFTRSSTTISAAATRMCAPASVCAAARTAAGCGSKCADGSDAAARPRRRSWSPSSPTSPAERERQIESFDTAARLHDSIEAISEAFVLWDSNDRLVVCNRKFKAIYKIPNRLLAPGTPFKAIAEAARETLLQGPRASDGAVKRQYDRL